MTTSAIHYLGKPFVYPTENMIGRFLETGRGWDAILAKVFPTLVDRDDPLLVEVGAHIGVSLVQMLAAKPKAFVVCFEPSDSYRPYLLRNIDFAGASGRVEVHHELLGAEPGEGVLYHNASSASVVGADYAAEVNAGDEAFAAREAQPARVTTLDAELGDRRLDFLKVDTNGHEFEVFAGARNLLGRSRPVLHFELAAALMDAPWDA